MLFVFLAGGPHSFLSAFQQHEHTGFSNESLEYDDMMNWYKTSQNDLDPSQEMTGEELPEETDDILPEEKSQEEKFNSTTVGGMIYHGTVIQSWQEVTDSLMTEFSDQKVIIGTEELPPAEIVSRSYSLEQNSIKYIPVVLQLAVRLGNVIQFHNKDVWRDFADSYALNEGNPATSAEFIRDLGYDGWIIRGVGRNTSQKEIAVLNIKSVQIVGVEVFLNVAWTRFMTLQEANSVIGRIRVVR